MARLAALPELLKTKLSKTGETRGATPAKIYQNRVPRRSTVLIPYPWWEHCAPTTAVGYENGFIVLISPEQYFATPGIEAELDAKGLELGRNLLVFYQKRGQWTANDPVALGWTPAANRLAPLGGQYVARVAGTTASGGKAKRIDWGFTTKDDRGAGIRVFEYASAAHTKQCELQLEALFWSCPDADTAATANGMKPADRDKRRTAILDRCQREGLLDLQRLRAARAVNARGLATCPLCLGLLAGEDFFRKMDQAEGREVHDSTATRVSLFHVRELRTGVLNHCPYNVAWGHHDCNVVVKDRGIVETLKWLKEVVDRNVTEGLFPG